MRKTLQLWTATCLITLALGVGCGDSSTQAPSSVTTAGSLASGGSAAQPAAAVGCPKLPEVAGIILNACCRSDNTCGVDGTSLNRGCLSYAELKKFFSFAAPPPSACDGTPLPTSAGAGVGAGAGGR
jgi:hypothetical protein